VFETGAIVFHIAEQHAGLLPKDPATRTRAIAWMFAALNVALQNRVSDRPHGSWRQA